MDSKRFEIKRSIPSIFVIRFTLEGAEDKKWRIEIF